MSTFVLFFGGWQASVSDVNAWTASARHQSPGDILDAYPYPVSTSSNGGEAVANFTAAGDFARRSMNPGEQSNTIYIMGRSSGCAIANAVDAQLKDHTKIILVALDGYCPSPAQLGRAGTQVWVAESRLGKSLHYDDLKKSVNEYDLKNKDWFWVNIHHAPADCTTKLALHFSLVKSFFQ